jgi:signal transduction histidine kinase
VARSQDQAGDPVAAELRQALAGLEQVMHERQSVVLEEFGLVAALEWLAERTQDHSNIGVDVELEGDLVDDPAALPREVERVAFRVAMLAMDNVVRHAAASRVVVRLFVDGSVASLRVTDDGRGPDQAPSARGGRGLVDMRAAAAEIGATLRVDQPGQGTRVELAWSRRAPVGGHHAITIVEPAGRRPTTAG